MRILIAGCGDLGNALGNRLTAEEHNLWGLRRKPGRPRSKIRPIPADLTDPLPELPADLDVVFFTAAPRNPTEGDYKRTYVDGMKNLLESLSAQGQSPSRVIFTSSTSVYGQADGEWVDEESETDPPDYRGKLMLEAEEVLRSGPFPSVIVRFGGIYGPGRVYMLRRIAKGRLPLPAKPHFTNRIHRADCVGVLHHLMHLDNPAPLYLGVDSDPVDKIELLKWLAEQLDAPAPKLAKPGDKSKERAGSKRCRNDLLLASGYSFKYPTYREGFGQMDGVRKY